MIKLIKKSADQVVKQLSRWRMKSKLKAIGLQRADSIPTYTSISELIQLYHLTMTCPQGAKALEIGSYFGASTCYIATALIERKGKIVCVDTWENQTMPEDKLDTYDQFLLNLKPVLDVITPIRMRSEEVPVDKFQDKFDFAFIDGDHSYAAVKRDFSLVEGLMAPNGIIAMHDYWAFSGVTRVVGEALASGDWIMEGRTENLCWLRRPKHQAKCEVV